MEQNSQPGFFDFESLELYKKSLDYVDFTYELIAGFPKEERFELSSQFRRAASSISLNIAEGYGETIPLAIRYLRIARGSIRECLGCSTIAFRRSFISEHIYFESRKRLIELSKMTAGYRKYLKNISDK